MRMELKEAKNEIISCFTDVMARTVAAIKSDFDAKLAAIQVQQVYRDQLYDDNFQFAPVSTPDELMQLEQNLLDKNFEKQVVRYPFFILIEYIYIKFLFLD